MDPSTPRYAIVEWIGSEINTVDGADTRIIAELQRIRANVDWRPAFKRGRMFFDFKSGKVRVAQPEHARAC